MDFLQSQNPRVRLAIIGGLLLTPFFTFGIWYWATRAPDNDDQLRRVVEKYGYKAVTPPTRLYGPGTFTTVETLPDGTLALHPTCIMNDDTLAAMWVRSPTVDESLLSDVERTFAASAKGLGSIVSNTTGKRISGFDFSLQNIYVVTLPDEGLSRIRRQYLKDTCEEVVLSNLIAGAQVCQTDEVLEADLLYKTNAHEEFGAGTKADIAGPVSASLEAGQQDKMRIEVRGVDLFLGAKVHQHCFQLDKGRIAQKGQTVAARN